MSNLKDVNQGYNKYCGPAVLSILTGRSTDECAYAITQVNGKYTIKGVTLPDLLKAADRLGFIAKEYDVFGSLFSVLTGMVKEDGMYIVTLPKHFVCIEIQDQQIRLCDNHTKEPIRAASSARLSQQVISMHLITKKPKPPKLEVSYSKLTLFECNYCKSRAFSEEQITHYSNCAYLLGISE